MEKLWTRVRGIGCSSREAFCPQRDSPSQRSPVNPAPPDQATIAPEDAGARECELDLFKIGDDVNQASDRLRAVGLRVTRPRVAVLAEVAAHPHADVETIGAGARACLGSLSMQAVYDVLHALTEAGLLRRVEPAGSAARFEVNTGDNHHHLVCRHCQRIVDVECAIGRAPCLQASDEAGYLVNEAEVTYWGLCSSCQHVREPTPPASTTRH
jgi:Fur family ferric uptake transcriptional regulator